MSRYLNSILDAALVGLDVDEGYDALRRSKSE